MFKKLSQTLQLKELELRAIRFKLKGHNIKERCKALMKLEPLKMEIDELKQRLSKDNAN